MNNIWMRYSYQSMSQSINRILTRGKNWYVPVQN